MIVYHLINHCLKKIKNLQLQNIYKISIVVKEIVHALLLNSPTSEFQHILFIDFTQVNPHPLYVYSNPVSDKIVVIQAGHVNLDTLWPLL